MSLPYWFLLPDLRMVAAQMHVLIGTMLRLTEQWHGLLTHNKERAPNIADQVFCIQALKHWRL